MQPKRPRFNPLILALALAGVLMIWSVLGTSDSSTGGSTMSYSTVVHYFENNQVTAFTLDRNTSIITLTLKEASRSCPKPQVPPLPHSLRRSAEQSVLLLHLFRGGDQKR